MASEINVSVQRIGPVEAGNLLKRNTVNRPCSDSRVKALSEIMKNGEFKENGEAIIISDTDKLLDGQHRLQAIINSATHHQMVITSNVPESYFDTIDTGKNRSASDVLYVDGYDKKLAGMLATACRMELLFDPATGSVQSNSVKYFYVSNHTIRMEAKNNKPLVESAIKIHEYHIRDTLVSSGDLTWFLYRTREQNKELADEFMDCFITGANLNNDHIILFLRNLLMRDKMATRKRTRFNKLRLLCRAWKLYSLGKWPKSQSSWSRDLDNELLVLVRETDELNEQ